MLMLLQVMDPCHANFTHHKVQGARSNEKGTDIKPLTPPTPAGVHLVSRASTVDACQQLLRQRAHT